MLLPCLNEGKTVQKTVEGFRAALPGAQIYVGDNNSSDDTAAAARAAGATVITVPQPGKGNVIRKLFALVEADVYIMADGDATYDPASAPAALQMLLSQNLDYINIARVGNQKQTYRPGHRFGNKLLTGFVSFIFKEKMKDMLSGYKVMSRKFVETFSGSAAGFEIETELTAHCMRRGFKHAEIEAEYYARPPGSESKLSTFKDGLKIFKTIFTLTKKERPFLFYGGVLFIFTAVSVLLYSTWRAF